MLRLVVDYLGQIAGTDVNCGSQIAGILEWEL